MRLTLRAGSGLVVLLWLSLAIWVGADLFASREREIDNARRTAGSMAKALAGHLEATIEKLDVSLLEFSIRYSQLPPEQRLRHSQMALVRYAALFPEAASFVLVSADGEIAALGTTRGGTNTANLSDREYFKTLRDNPEAGLVVSEPLISRLNGSDWVVVLARRVVDGKGKFAGIILAGVRADYFEHFFATLDIGHHGAITLWTRDMTMFARWPIREDWRGRVMPDSQVPPRLAAGETVGSFFNQGQITPGERLTSFRAMDSLPFVFTVSLARGEILAGWYRRALTYGLLGGLTTLALGLLAWAWARNFWQTSTLARYMTKAYLAKERESRALLDAIPAPAWLVDQDGRYVAYNDAMRKLTQSGEEFYGRHGSELFPPALCGILQQERELPREGGVTTRREYWVDLGEGPQAFEFMATPVCDDKGQQIALAGVAWDITARYRAEERRRLITQVFDHSTEAILILDGERRIVDANAAFHQLTGYTEPESQGLPFAALTAREHKGEAFENIAGHLLLGDAWRGETWLRGKDGVERPVWCSISLIRNEHGRLVNFIMLMTDLSARIEAEARIDTLAHVDQLTLLPNRQGFARILARWLEEGRSGGLIVLDLDQLARVNDAFGHETGDRMLGEVGQRLRRELRDSDVLGRLGGDQFGVLTDEAGVDGLEAMTLKLLEAVAQPMPLHSGDIVSTACAGICHFPSDGTNASVLMRNADAAMHHAKASGPNSFRFFASSMNTHVAERLRLESDLRSALARGELELHYQPQVDVRDGHVVGVESLLRWRHAEFGMVSPAQFIPLAEESRLILPIGNWVINEACRQAVAWQRAGLPRFVVAVNISALQFHAGDIVGVVSLALEKSGLEARWLEIEITESAIMNDPERVVGLLGELKALGVRLSIDDFGTGYSSLSYLKRFPVDTIKIDQSFVRDVATNAEDAAIVRMVIGIAEELQHRVIAEGVETAQQLDLLREYRCDEYQGYFFSRPVPADAVPALLGMAAPETKTEA